MTNEIITPIESLIHAFQKGKGLITITLRNNKYQYYNWEIKQILVNSDGTVNIDSNHFIQRLTFDKSDLVSVEYMSIDVIQDLNKEENVI